MQRRGGRGRAERNTTEYDSLIFLHTGYGYGDEFFVTDAVKIDVPLRITEGWLRKKIKGRWLGGLGVPAAYPIRPIRCNPEWSVSLSLSLSLYVIR